MKNLIAVLIAVIFLVSFAFAQSNNSTLDQNGDWNYGKVDQTGSTNNANIAQVYNGSQLGNSVGNGKYAARSNEAILMQIGMGHSATITQVGDYAASHEWGNITKVNQSGGNGNIASITQEGVNKYINWDGTDYGRGVYVDQLGNSNITTIFQRGRANTTTVDQQGDGNIASSTMTGHGSKNDYDIIQSGDVNIATQTFTVTHTSFYHRNIGYINQSGGGNTATQAAAGRVGDFGRTGVDQNIMQQGDLAGGNNNSAIQTLNSSQLTYGNSQDIDQIGHDNNATQTMENHTVYKGHMSAIVFQQGIGNTATETQLDTDGSTATVNQVGNYNNGTITQSK